jgi:hypothetical protein
MMVRILLHTIDPSISFSETSGLGATLSYVSEEDTKEGKIKMNSPEEREESRMTLV